MSTDGWTLTPASGSDVELPTVDGLRSAAQRLEASELLVLQLIDRLMKMPEADRIRYGFDDDEGFAVAKSAAEENESADTLHRWAESLEAERWSPESR